MILVRRVSKNERWLHVVPTRPPGRDARPPELDDDALIDAVVGGDSRVAAQIHDRLIPIVEGTLYRVFGRYEPDHDDLVQTAFEQIVRTLKERRFARACSLSTWASAVSAHVAFKALRSRRRERHIFTFHQDDADIKMRAGATDVEREVDSRLQVEQARAHLAAMNPEQATIVVLHDVFGHELAEIAVLTNVSVSAAQSRLVRGRRELWRRIGVAPPKGRKQDLEE